MLLGVMLHKNIVPLISTYDFKGHSICLKNIYQFLHKLKHNNCMNNPVRHKKLIKNQIKSSKLIYDNTFTNKKPRKNSKSSNFDDLG